MPSIGGAGSDGRLRTADAVVVGAGFAGLYMLYRLRDLLGLKTVVFEAGDGVGGTWYWNRYPGARCDIPSIHYSYSFSDELEQEWTWSEKYSAQGEILKYLDHVADKFDLRRDIVFGTRVVGATFEEATARWIVGTDKGDRIAATYFVSAAGVLSAASVPSFPGGDRFEGERYYTFKWPREPVSFAGKRVGIIGTGATAMQVIPIVAEEAEHLTVFQRTANYAAPLGNRPLEPPEERRVKGMYRELRRKAWYAFAGVPFDTARPSARAVSPAERLAHFQDCWDEGGFSLWLGSYDDLLIDLEANEMAAEFVRAKIRERVKNPEVAQMLCPKPGLPYGTKRQPCETGYYEAFNRPSVTLVDIGAAPIEELTATGVRTRDASYDLDCLIYATGFDAFTGPLYRMNIRGREGRALQEHWKDGPRTYLGLATHGFPNFFIITGPMSPSVLFNMPLGIEQNCEWITDCIEAMRRRGHAAIEADVEAEDRWIAHAREVADHTLLPKADSWYLGANIPGKPRVFMVYLGGGRQYRQICDDIAAKGYEGFTMLSKAAQPRRAAG